MRLDSGREGGQQLIARMSQDGAVKVEIRLDRVARGKVGPSHRLKRQPDRLDPLVRRPSGRQRRRLGLDHPAQLEEAVHEGGARRLAQLPLHDVVVEPVPQRPRPHHGAAPGRHLEQALASEQLDRFAQGGTRYPVFPGQQVGIGQHDAGLEQATHDAAPKRLGRQGVAGTIAGSLGRSSSPRGQGLSWLCGRLSPLVIRKQGRVGNRHRPAIGTATGAAAS